MLALTFFDSYQATFGGHPLDPFRTRKEQALLVYLAVERSSASGQREKLMTLLWPGMPQRSAQSNLRQLIYRLRKIVPPGQDDDSRAPVEFLLSDHQRVQINPAYPCQVDVVAFKDLLQHAWDHDHPDVLTCPECAQRLREAVNLYRGDFLADFYLSDSNEFEEWAAITRENLSRCALDALEILTEICIRQKDYRQARVFADRQLQLDNLRESAYRQLMTILALSGRHSEALAVYETCRRLLAKELGMAPTARTTSLSEKILAGEVSLPEIPLAGVRGYELKEEIGSGPFGTVQRAIQTSIGREVAIKVIHPVYANNPEFIRRFESEAQIIACLEHPHIVPLYDYWREPDRALLVMRLFRGGSLRSALQVGPWPVDRVANLVEQIAPALNAAHQHGIIHRNLKPANILLDEEGYTYLSDFGIAIDLGKDMDRNARIALSSSPDYISPEQILDEPMSPQSDIYCLGLVLYEALAGEKPFEQASPAGLLKKQLEEPLPLLSAMKPELPAQVDAVIQRATAKNPVDRYPDALALAADFRRAVRDEEVVAGFVSPLPLSAGQARINPYKGLRPFREEDAEDFFGREALVKQLLASLAKSRFLAVVGPSGSGKSSVVSAGLIPALRAGALPGSQKWFVAQMTPGSHPFEAMEQALLKIAVNPPPSLVEPMLKDQRGLLRTIRRILPEGDARLLLVIDQFEELYTLTRDEKQRDHFITNLLAAIDERGSPLRVVVTLRADFYDRPLGYLPLGEMLQEHSEVVLPLSLEELEQAIQGPALKAGVQLEAGLVAAIAADVSNQPGALPLLQYALTELYEARQDHTLTRSAYQAMGGISGALGRRAESLFETLDDHEQACARQVFLRLVTLGEGVEDTRRRVLHAELESLGEDGGKNTLDHVLERFGSYRLLTFDRDPLTRGATVEVAHEALLGEWSRLRSWLDESQEDIRLQRQLAEAAAEWQQAGRDEDYLLHGSRQEQFAAWAKGTSLALTEEERLFLDSSIQFHQRRLAAEAERAAHERGLEKRSRNFLGALVGVLAIATIAALILSNFAFGQRDLFREESLARATAQAELDRERDDAEMQAKVARSRELASLAQLKLIEDPELGMLLALEGLRSSRTTEAENALRLSLHSSRLERTLYGHHWVYWLRVSPDGKTLASNATSFDGGAKVWDIASGRLLFTFPGADITYQMGGEQLVTTALDEEEFIRIIQRTWSAETGEQIAERLVPNVQLVVNKTQYYFDWDLNRIILGYDDGHVELRDALSGELLLSWQAHDVGIRDMVFSPDDRWVVTTTPLELKVWDSQSGAELFLLTAFSCCGASNSAAFSPDGRLLAASSQATNEAIIWDVEASIQAGEGQALFTLRGHTALINAYAFSADGTRLATGGDDGTARVWSMNDGQLLFTLSGHQPRVSAVAFTPDGMHLISADAAGDIRIWDLSPSGTREVSTLVAAPFMDLDYSPDGSRFAAVGLDGRLRVWSDPSEELLLDIQAHEGFAFEVDFSPDGRQIATTGSDNRAVIWDAESGEELFSIQGHGEGFYASFWPNYQSVAYSPDGQRLATGGADGIVKLWDAGQGDEVTLSHPLSLTHGTSPAAVASLAFSPNGRYLAVAGDGDQALVYDSHTGELVLVADTDPDRMGALSFSPDGSKLTVGHWGGDLRVIDFPASLVGGASVELYMIPGNRYFIFKTAFSPDGRYLATASRDTIVRVWEADNGEPLFELTGMFDSVLGVQFSPDGKHLRVASLDGSLRKYVVSTEELIDLAYSRLTRWWRPEECNQYLRQAECPAPQQEIIRVDYATSSDEFAGTWQTENVLANIFLRFQEDGRLIVAQTLAGLDEAPLVEATYEMDGEILSMQDSLCGDQVGQYRLRLVREPGQPLRLIVGSVADSCLPRLKGMNGSYVQVEP